ncbi:MAG: LCP family protein, partial [Thermomicrobiales bacterium]
MGLAILVASAWLALIVVSRIDELFFPGQGITGLPSLPGVETSGATQGKINLLVMGLDRRPTEGAAPTRTDTIFIVTIDSETKTAGLLGIPRDSWVQIPFRDGEGFYESRINTVYATGELQDYAGGGPGLVKQVIERNIGISIDHYIVIDFEGFVDIIEELDGIDIY